PPELFAQRLEPVGRAGAQRRKFEIGHPDNGFGMEFAEPAEPDHPDAQAVHAILPKSLRASVRVSSPDCPPAAHNRPGSPRRSRHSRHRKRETRSPAPPPPARRSAPADTSGRGAAASLGPG